jgi:proteinaceous RNase P
MRGKGVALSEAAYVSVIRAKALGGEPEVRYRMGWDGMGWERVCVVGGCWVLGRGRGRRFGGSPITTHSTHSTPTHLPTYLPTHPQEAERVMDEMLAAKQRPRLRSYSPLILGYAAQGKADRAFAVYDRMCMPSSSFSSPTAASGKEGMGEATAAIEPTEAELAALLRVASATKDEKRFLRALEDMQALVLEPTQETWDAVEGWFGALSSSNSSSSSNSKDGDGAGGGASRDDVRITRPTRIGADGACAACGGRLLSVDMSAEGSEELLAMVEEIVLQNEERRGDWARFKAWLADAVARDAFDVVVDGANVGYYQMNYAGAAPHVNYAQIAWVVEHLYRQGRKPLLVLHARHVQDKRVPPTFLPLVRRWRESGILYTVPYKSNDDWFWLCATVKRGGRTLVVTNDQMRDHHFQMLSRRTFLRWRERHQAEFSLGGMGRDGARAVKVEEPPVFSRCIQGPATEGVGGDGGGGGEGEGEEEGGVLTSRWHVPLAESQDWLCVVHTRRQRRREGEAGSG